MPDRLDGDLDKIKAGLGDVDNLRGDIDRRSIFFLLTKELFMKKHWWFLFAFLSMASYFSPAFAASYRYQVEPVSAHQYVIRLESDTPQPFSMMLEGMKQKAQEVCGGYYRILQIDPETTQNILAMVECQTSQPLTTSPSIKQRQPIIQKATPIVTEQQYDVANISRIGLNRFQFGIGGGINFPLDDVGKFTTLTPSVNGTALYNLSNTLKIESDLSYWWFGISEDTSPEEDFDMSLIALIGGIRYYLTPVIHINGGAGLYRFSWDYVNKDLFGYKIDVEDSNLELGFYGGVGYERPPFEVKARFQMSDFYVFDFWSLGISATYFFSL